MNAYAAVIGRIHKELGDLDRLVSRAQDLEALATRTGQLEVLDGVALNLHAFYASVERIFESVARDVDGGLPSGPEWHRELLVQMSASLPGDREPVIGDVTAACLDDYRGFRHVVRNAYTFKLAGRARAAAGARAAGLRPCPTL
jgi:hypothetical protein